MDAGHTGNVLEWIGAGTGTGTEKSFNLPFQMMASTQASQGEFGATVAELLQAMGQWLGSLHHCKPILPHQ